MSKVLVIGGGPGGAVAAAILAKHGVEVVLLERETFPRHHVGESLQPALFHLLERHLGMKQVFAKAGFARKYGAVYVWGESREPWSVLFDTRLEEGLSDLSEESLLSGDYEHAWQVDRARFDQILLDEARNNGVDVREGVEVAKALTDVDRVTGVVLRDGTEIEADWVLDASGQRCLLGQTFGLTRQVEDMKATATYAYYRGAGGLPGVLGRHAQWVVTTEDGWCWFIPTGPDTTSVGVVTREKRVLSEAEFGAAVERAGFPLAGASVIPAADGGDLWFAKDWSFTNSRLVGENWMLVGDAASFVDPILSGGVDFAVRTACRGALALLRALDGEPWPVLAEDYQVTFRREYKAYLRIARYWYGNNRSVEGLFWEAHNEISPNSMIAPLRAFVYLTTGNYAAERHFKVFAEWQERKMFEKLGVDASALHRARAKRDQTDD